MALSAGTVRPMIYMPEQLLPEDRDSGVEMMQETPRRRPRPAVRAAMVLFVAFQIAWPALGLYISHDQDNTVRYAWSMFSRVPEFVDGK